LSKRNISTPVAVEEDESEDREEIGEDEVRGEVEVRTVIGRTKGSCDLGSESVVPSIFIGRVCWRNTFEGTVLSVVDRNEDTESDDGTGEEEEETGSKEREKL